MLKILFAITIGVTLKFNFSQRKSHHLLHSFRKIGTLRSRNDKEDSVDNLRSIFSSFLLQLLFFFSQSGTKLAPVSEAEVRAAFTARLGMPLTGQMLHGTLPFYPSLTVIEGEPAYIHKQIQQSLQEQAAPPPSAAAVGGGSRQHSAAAAAAVYHTAAPITDTQVAHARLHKAGHRPLGSMFPLCLRRSPYTARVPCSNWTMVSLE